ncbi:uncharacterized protein [Miscanthus floridulus]|uniref:uncharacterized protein n=1 Tax=Miscanthus floridulus TaxID=154761 RepID=UPI00345982E1
MEVAPEASASSLAPPGMGGEADPGPAVARSGAKADTPEARALGKRAVSPVGSMAAAEQVAVEATPPPPQRTEGAPGLISFSRKWPADDLPLAPLKALKASPGSSAHWVAEAQAAIQRGAASARVDPKGPVAHGGVTEAAPTQSDGAIVPFVAEAPGASEAEAMEATAPTTAETAVAAVGVSTSAEATMAEAGAPETAEAMIAEAGAPGVIEAVVMAARPSMQEAETQAAEASIVPLAQGPPLLRESAWETEVYLISSDDTSRAREVVDVEETDAVEQPSLLLDEGGSALVRVRPEPRGWDHPRSEAEFTRAAEASSAVQTMLDTEIKEHEALKRATLSAYEALEVEGVHDGYVLPDDDEEADTAVAKLMEAAEGPGVALATLFEEEVVPPLPSAGAEGPEP